MKLHLFLVFLEQLVLVLAYSESLCGDPSRFFRIWDLTYFKVGYQDFEEKGKQDSGNEIKLGTRLGHVMMLASGNLVYTCRAKPSEQSELRFLKCQEKLMKATYTLHKLL